MRIAKWDNLKFVLIYFVVLGHFINLLKGDSYFIKGLHFFIYTFHMPAFLFVSGLFSKRTVDGHKYERVIPYFFLFIFMKIFRFLVYSIGSGKASGFGFFTETGVPWFALTLFLCYLLTMAVSRFPHEYVMVMAVCIGMMAGYDKDLGGFLTGMRLFTLYPFFYAGYCADREKLTALVEKKTVRLASWVVLAGTLAVSYLMQDRLYNKMNFLKGKAGYEALKLLPYGGLYRGIYYVIALFLVICVVAVVPSKKCVISVWGKRTIQVFALHFPILWVMIKKLHFEKWLRAILPGGYMYLVPAVALVVTVVLSAGFMEPFFNWLMHPKMQKDEMKESCS